MAIAEEGGADLTVVRLFALLHDCCRMNDGADPDHGPRAAEMIDRIVPTIFALDRDRLGIGCIGIIPAAWYMSTAAG